MQNIEITKFFFDGFKKEIESIENKVTIVLILFHHHHHNFLCADQEGINSYLGIPSIIEQKVKKLRIDWKVKNSKNRQYDNTNFDDKRDFEPLHFV
jgi:hypothetical protein